MQPPSLPPVPSVWPANSQPQLQPPASPVRQLSFQEQRAATHIAEGLLPLRQVSLVTGLSQARLTLLSSQDPDFQDQVSFLREEFAARVLSTGLALRAVRQERLNERARLLDRLLSERAMVALPPGPENPFHDPDSLGVPGASTGLLVKTLRSVGSGPMAQVVDEWQLDRPVLRELAELEQQAAREAGQWRDVKVVESTTKAYIGIRIEDV